MSLQLLNNYSQIVVVTTSPFFLNMAKSLYGALSDLKFNVQLDPLIQQFNDNHLYILFGPHCWNNLPLPKNCIIVHPGPYTGYAVKLIQDKIIDGALQLWDYSIDNISNYSNKKWAEKSVYIPFYYHPNMEAPFSKKYVDVLFVGSLSPHRSEIINRLKQEGIHVVIPNKFGDSLAQLLSRCKIGLNIHYFDESKPTIIESSRINLMLANKVCVVSEDCSHKEDLKSYKDAILIPKDLDEMVSI